MKGTIVDTWLRTARKLWGEETVSSIMQQIGWSPERIFLPTEDIPDQLPRRMGDLLLNDCKYRRGRFGIPLVRIILKPLRAFSRLFFNQIHYMVFCLRCMMCT